MTSNEFKDRWTLSGDRLNTFTRVRLAEFSLMEETVSFLETAGLPCDAAPFLTFSDSSHDRFSGISLLTDQYDFLEPEFKKWVVIGSCSDGDPIAINTEANDIIEWLDHDNYFDASFFNSSINALAGCLLAYREFVQEVQKANGESAFIDADFTDVQFNTLKNKLLSIDSKALSVGGFWEEELSMALAMRKEIQKR